MTSSTSATSSGSSARGDLVEQQQVGLHRERADDRDALLLAAGQAVRVLVALVGQAEAVEQVRRARARRPAADARGPCAAPASRCPSTDHVREQVEGLEDDADPAPDPVDVDAACGDLLAVDDDPPGVDRLDAG